MEVDSTLIERWLAVPAHRAEIEALNGRISADVIRVKTGENIQGLRNTADRVFTSFIELFGDLRKRDPSPHR
jgi:hypothetical protein